MKKKHTIIGRCLVAILMSAMLLGGCGSSSSNEAISADTTSSYSRDGGAFYATADAAAESEIAAEEAVDSTSNTTVTENAQTTNRKLIKTVDLTVETEDYDDLLTLLQQKAEALGGYAESFSTSGSEGYRYGNMTLRIPSDQLDTFLATVEGESNITYRSETVEDVTLDYVDVESRKKMLETEEERLLELLEQATTVEDIIAIEERLTEVQYQLESSESQLRTYDNQIDYSTVYLYVEEVETYTPLAEESTWSKISRGFMENLVGVGEGIRDFFIAFIIHIPNIIVAAAVIAILALIVRACIRLRRKHKEKKKQNFDQSNKPQQ